MQSKTPVVGIGAGGHAKVILDILQYYDEYHVVGLTNADPGTHGQTVLGVLVLGGDEILPRLWTEGVTCAFIGVGSIGDSALRQRLFEEALVQEFRIINAIHPNATVAQSVKMGQGTVVMAQAVLNPDVVVGANVIINTGAQVDHDCIVGDHAHVAPGAHVSGGVTIGSSAHIGVGATIIQGIKIGESAIIGAGSLVLRDVPPGVTVFGVPAKAAIRRG